MPVLTPQYPASPVFQSPGSSTVAQQREQLISTQQQQQLLQQLDPAAQLAAWAATRCQKHQQGVLPRAAVPLGLPEGPIAGDQVHTDCSA
jgi:hypothetical protein